MNKANTSSNYEILISLPLLASQPKWIVRQNDIKSLIDTFNPISLKEMEGAALLNRVDTKFVMTLGQVQSALQALQADYSALSIGGQHMNHYRSLYFDTPEFTLYHDHVNGRAERYKVRSREYTDSHLSFFEVKHKTRKNRTVKERIPTSSQVVEITPEMVSWLQGIAPINGSLLEPKLWNTFTRVTLVSKTVSERVTLDFDLTFYSEQATASMDGLVIAEVKYDASRAHSPFLQQMRAQRILPHGFSKYSIGVAMLYEHVKKNAFKPKMLWLERLNGRVANHERYC